MNCKFIYCISTKGNINKSINSFVNFSKTFSTNVKMLRKKLKIDHVVENLNSDQSVQYEASNSISSIILDIEKSMCKSLEKIVLPASVPYFYNPLEYAWEPHSEYMRKFCNTKKPVIFLGINPGPFGMCQTGIPFGEVSAVKNFLGIEKPVSKPEKQCLVRPIQGFDCPKSEVSGFRFWGYFQKLCGSSDKFFQNAFVYNYCPLAFMKNNGKNVTPEELPDNKLKKLIEDVCDKTLLQIFEILEVKEVVGVGNFAKKRAIDTLKKGNIQGINVYYMPHPSPRAVNNTNWHEKAEKFLQDNDLMKYFI